MSPLQWVALAIVIWIALVSLAYFVILPWLTSGPSTHPFVGLCWRFLKIYTRVIHRLEVTGLELVPQSKRPGPLVVVCNHTGSVDPLLVSRHCPFMIRWMMGDDLMWSRMAPLWEMLEVIPVDRTGVQPGALKTALRTLRSKGVVGIFPEGRITLPRGEIRPFFGGVGGMIARGKADTLLVWIEGTAETDQILPSLFGRCHATVHFLDYIPYDSEQDSGAITEQLRSKLIAASGWKAHDEALPLILPEDGPF